MKKIILTTVAAATLLIASNNEYKYELSPMFSKIDTASNIEHETHNALGLSLGINKDEKCLIDQIELGFLRSDNVNYKGLKNTSADLTRIFVNGIKEYKISDKTKLYALAGLGHEENDNELLGNDGGVFGSIGVGIKYALTKTFALKADVRELVQLDGDSNTVYTIGFAIPFGKKSVSKPVVEEKKPIVVEPVVLNKPEDLGIVFDTNSAKIHSSDEVKFTKYVNYLGKVKDAGVVVEGHTDSVGSLKDNQVLSEKRANSAKNKLVNMGVKATRIETVGYGETKPLVANDTEENKQINRRVTARIVKK